MSDNDNIQTNSDNADSGITDPQFLSATNDFIDMANKLGREMGLKRVSAAILYAAARYNSHGYVGFETSLEENKPLFIGYMTDLYTKMLNENLDNLIMERKAAGQQQGK